MTLLLKLFSRRRHKRYRVAPGAYFVVSPYTDGERKTDIVDISQGGCAFVYEGDLGIHCSGLATLMRGDIPAIERLTFSTVSDRPIYADMRRRGVEFVWLGKTCSQTLGRFIRQVRQGR